MNNTDVSLPEDLLPLIDSLAENVHEAWAKRRKEQGWTYGKFRDDLKKEHPCLVPYRELSEDEKEYDRITALQTIRFIMEKGFDIIKK